MSLTIENLKVTLQKKEILHGINLDAKEGEFISLLGASGCGKTTLLKSIAGLLDVQDGNIRIRKESVLGVAPEKRGTIIVFQDLRLFPHMTVEKNITFPMELKRVPKEEQRANVKKLLEAVQLSGFEKRKMREMSGGQMQRVAIARALVNDPEILLADEPTGALDSDTSIQVMDLLQEVAKERLVVMVTHNPELAELYANRIVTLRDGVICSDTNPFEPDSETLLPPKHKNMGKSSMSFLTALSLSFNNLRTKKARTLLTSFAGSIGIIGIALILALSSGVNEYIQNMEMTVGMW